MKILVAGAGQMGGGIAQVAALAVAADGRQPDAIAAGRSNGAR